MIKGTGPTGTQKVIWIKVTHSAVTAAGQFANALSYAIAQTIEAAQKAGDMPVAVETKTFTVQAAVSKYLAETELPAAPSSEKQQKDISARMAQISKSLQAQDTVKFKNSVYSYPQWQRRGRQVRFGETSIMLIDGIPVFSFEQTKISDSRVTELISSPDY